VTDLPAGWEWATFKDVARVASNLTDPVDFPRSPHLAPNYVESGTGRLLPYKTIAEDGVTSPKHRFFSGQIIYSKIRPYLAKAVLATFDGLCSADMYPIDSYIEPRYLFWWMLSPTFTANASSYQARTVLPKINERALAQLPVPVPPLAEQRRIVAALENHLSRLDFAVSHLTAVGERCKRLHARLLDRAVSGQMSGRGAGDAKALLVRIERGRQVMMSRHRSPCAPDSSLRFPLPLGWAWASLDALSYDSSYGTSTKCDYDGRGVSVLRIPNVQKGEIDLGDVKHALDKSLDLSNLYLRPGDLLFVRTNGSRDLIGRMAVVREGLAVAFASYLIRFRLVPDGVDPDWVALVVSSPRWRRHLERAAASSAGQYNLSTRVLAPLPIPIPPADEQQEIIRRVRDESDAMRRLDESLRSVSHRGLHLRQALLRESFGGRLVAQDPNDEPASELLARIVAERSVAASVRRARGRRPRKELPAPATRVIGDAYEQEELPL
jgi:type I restriction enzyme S subunit